MNNEGFTCVRKCAVCGKEGEIIYRHSLIDHGWKYGYCPECIAEKVEPYAACVEAVDDIGWDNLTEAEVEIIDRSLLKANKTHDDLFKDVAYMYKSYVEWCESELGSNGNLY